MSEELRTVGPPLAVTVWFCGECNGIALGTVEEAEHRLGCTGQMEGIPYYRAEDDAAERMAQGMYSIHRLPEFSTDGSTSPKWGRVPGDLKDYWRRIALAGLRSLRGERP